MRSVQRSPHVLVMLALAASTMAIAAVWDSGPLPESFVSSSFRPAGKDHQDVRLMRGQALKFVEHAKATPATLHALPLGILGAMALAYACCKKSARRGLKVAVRPVASMTFCNHAAPTLSILRKPALAAAAVEGTYIGDLGFDFGASAATDEIRAEMPAEGLGAAAKAAAAAGRRSLPKGRSRRSGEGFFARRARRRIGSKLLRQGVSMERSSTPSYDPSKVPRRLQSASQCSSSTSANRAVFFGPAVRAMKCDDVLYSGVQNIKDDGQSLAKRLRVEHVQSMPRKRNHSETKEDV